MPFDVKQHSHNSTLRETILEHAFVAEMLKEAWKLGITDLEILRSEFDGYGYDLVITKGATVRHVQMKSGKGKPSARISVQESLFLRPSACVIHLRIDDDLEVREYYFLGGEEHESLPRECALSVATKGVYSRDGKKHERPGHYLLDKSKFEKYASVPALLERMLKL